MPRQGVSFDCRDHDKSGYDIYVYVFSLYCVRCKQLPNKFHFFLGKGGKNKTRKSIVTFSISSSRLLVTPRCEIDPVTHRWRRKIAKLTYAPVAHINHYASMCNTLYKWSHSDAITTQCDSRWAVSTLVAHISRQRLFHFASYDIRGNATRCVSHVCHHIAQYRISSVDTAWRVFVSHYTLCDSRVSATGYTTIRIHVRACVTVWIQIEHTPSQSLAVTAVLVCGFSP